MSKPAIHFTPGRLWSLWDMLEINSEKFIAAVDELATLGQCIHHSASSRADGGRNLEVTVSQSDRNHTHQLLDALRALELSSAVKAASRLTEAFTAEFIAAPTAQHLIRDVHQRMKDELDAVIFLCIPDRECALYRQIEPPFGAEVEAKFPQMSEDISEAAKCIALERPTAAVFHLMRVMEIGTQKFGDALGVQLPTQKNWQNILDEVNKAIKELDQKTSKTKAYAATSAHLYNVKLAWRNEVMHPKQTYTHEEATKVFSAVDAFTRDLASIL